VFHTHHTDFCNKVLHMISLFDNDKKNVESQIIPKSDQYKINTNLILYLQKNIE
jgi:hypothetical protein